VYAVPQKVWIDGHLSFDRAKDLAGREAVLKNRAQLTAQQKARPEAPTAAPKPPSGAEFDEFKGRFVGDRVCLHDGHQEGE
jgi:hypothetical protein